MQKKKMYLINDMNKKEGFYFVINPHMLRRQTEESGGRSAGYGGGRGRFGASDGIPPPVTLLRSVLASIKPA